MQPTLRASVRRYGRLACAAAIASAILCPRAARANWGLDARAAAPAAAPAASPAASPAAAPAASPAAIEATPAASAADAGQTVGRNELPMPPAEPPPPTPTPAPAGSPDRSAAASASPPPEARGAETAEPATSWSGLPPLQMHAFVGQGFIKSTENNFLVNSKRGSFEFTEVGINFTQGLTDRLRLGLQIFARRLGKDGDFTARTDWFYLSYRFTDWLGLRAGRTKIPFGLYNEVNDIDSARVPILLPQSVYPILNRTILLAQTGLELYGYFRLAAAGGLEYRLYGGTLYTPPPAAPAGTTLVNYEIPYLAGGRLMWETPLEGLRVGGSSQVLRLNSRFGVTGAMPPVLIDYDLPFFLWLASVEFAREDLIVAAEYGRWRADIELTGAPTLRVVNERYYVMAAYKVASWLTPGAYYASLITDVNQPMRRDNYRRDAALTLRFDVNRYWIVKLEGHYMNGTNELSSELNDGVAPAMLGKDWFLFLAKTTAYF